MFGKTPLKNQFFFLVKRHRLGWISDLPALTVPESPSFLLRFPDRATDRKRAPPGLVVPLHAFSSLFSPSFSSSFFSSALKRTRSHSKFKSETHTHTRERERDSISSFVSHKKRTFFILDLRFHVVDRVRRLHLERDRLPGQRFHENLHFFCCCSSSSLLAHVTNNVVSNESLSSSRGGKTPPCRRSFRV